MYFTVSHYASTSFKICMQTLQHAVHLTHVPKPIERAKQRAILKKEKEDKKRAEEEKLEASL